MALSATPDLSRMHAAVLGGGVFRSLDGGRSWQPAESGMTGVLDLQTLARNPADPETLWAGSPAHGVLRSRDGGRTWETWNDGLSEGLSKGIGGNPSGVSVKALRAVPGPGGTILYAGSIEGRVWRRDARASGAAGGERWHPAGEPLGPPIFVLAADPRDPSRMWAGTAGGLFRSVDGGDSWSEASDGLPSRFVKGVAASPVTPDEVWAGTGAGAARSVDGGRTWQPLEESTSGLPPVEVRIFVFDRDDPARMWAGSAEGLFTSFDGGESWQPDESGLPQTEINTLLEAGGPVGDVLLAGLAGAGVAISAPISTGDQAAWTMTNGGLTGTAVASLASDPLAPELLWAGVRGEGVLAKPPDSEPPGASPWIFPGGSPGPEPVLALQALAGELPGTRVLLAALAGRGLRRSIDNGRTWTEPFGLPTGTVVALEPIPDTDTVLAALPGSGVYGSADLGATWEPHTGGLTDLTVRALAASVSEPGTVYAATDHGAVFVSHDDGISWSRPGTGPAPGLRALAVDPEDTGRVWAGTAVAGVFESLDGGRTWSERNRGLGGDPGSLDIRDLAVDTAGRIWAATAGGVFLTHPSGSAWRRAAPGLPLADVLAVLPDPRDPERVWAALNGRGVAVLQRRTPGDSEELRPRRPFD